MSKRKRVRVKCKINEKESIQSVEKLFRCADWSEREMYDMFGVVINNHPFMKRILMPDDWEGFPLRKTYPLQGMSLPHGMKWIKSSAKRHVRLSDLKTVIRHELIVTIPNVFHA